MLEHEASLWRFNYQRNWQILEPVKTNPLGKTSMDNYFFKELVGNLAFVTKVELYPVKRVLNRTFPSSLGIWVNQTTKTEYRHQNHR